MQVSLWYSNWLFGMFASAANAATAVVVIVDVK